MGIDDVGSGPLRLVPLPVQGLIGRFQVTENAAAALQVLRAVGGHWLLAPRGAVEQLAAQVPFEVRDVGADDGAARRRVHRRRG